MLVVFHKIGILEWRLFVKITPFDHLRDGIEPGVWYSEVQYILKGCPIIIIVRSSEV